MEKTKVDIQHEVLFRSLKGALQDDSDESLQAGLMVLSWARQAMGRAFSPHHQVEAGKNVSATIGEALLMRDKKRFNPEFMQAWVDEFGVESVFPESAGKRLISMWIENIGKDLSRSHSSLAPQAAPLLIWLFDRAPQSGIPRDLLPKLATQLENTRGASGMNASLAALLERVARHATVQTDPRRPPARWLPASVLLGDAAMDLSAKVMCPSGKERTLREWADLCVVSQTNTHDRYGSSKDGAGSPSTIPKLPHGRRMELARDWILDENIDLDTARARLWACAHEKPEAVYQVLSWHQSPPRGKPDLPERVEALFKARDHFGRGIMAWLAIMEDNSKVHLTDHIHRTLDISPDDVLSSDGAGLVEQMLLGRRMGFADDAFHGRWVSNLKKRGLGEDLIAGPVDRRDAIISDLVDLVLPFSTQKELAKLMEDITSDPRLIVANAWSDLLANIAHPPKESIGGGIRSSSYEYGARQTQNLRGHIDSAIKTMADHPGALDIGTIEWRQWGPMFLDKALHYEVIAKYSTALKSALPDLERVVAANQMHLSTPDLKTVKSQPRL